MEHQLNPKIFDKGFSMIPEVRIRIIEIVDEFLGQIDPTINFNVLDIRLVGSNAGYNYTDKSDLDVHIVVNLAEICREHPEVVQCLFNSEKSRFNLNYDISVKGVQVEIYVEDVRAGTVSKGIYSVLTDQWIKIPDVSLQVADPSEVVGTVDYEDLSSQVRCLITSDNTTSEELINMIDSIYISRKNALESTEGESAYGNLMFKQLRNDGLLDALKSKYYDVRSKELSLEGVRR